MVNTKHDDNSGPLYNTASNNGDVNKNDKINQNEDDDDDDDV